MYDFVGVSDEVSSWLDTTEFGGILDQKLQVTRRGIAGVFRGGEKFNGNFAVRNNSGSTLNSWNLCHDLSLAVN